MSPAARGTGAGPRLLRHIEGAARSRAFWEREGFTTVLTDSPVTLGSRTQMARRMGKALHAGPATDMSPLRPS